MVSEVKVSQTFASLTTNEWATFKPQMLKWHA